MQHPLYMESKKKMLLTNLFTNQKQTQRLKKHTVTSMEGFGEGLVREFGGDMSTPLLPLMLLGRFSRVRPCATP